MANSGLLANPAAKDLAGGYANNSLNLRQKGGRQLAVLPYHPNLLQKINDSSPKTRNSTLTLALRLQRNIPEELLMTRAVMETSKGTIHLQLFDADAPKTVQNFVDLSKSGYYDGLAFHRVIDDFMIQGGCPNTRAGASGMPGTGGPGYTIQCEINGNKHEAGSLSMAHRGKDTGGSQFFICHSPQPHLDGVHTVFGKTEDMDVVNAIRQGDRILSVKIEAESL